MEERIETHRFYKEGTSWYIDLPAYLEEGGSLGDLLMVAGADTMLDYMACGEKEVTVALSTAPFSGADVLELTEKCDPSVGGAYYLLRYYEGKHLDQRMWLCGVTEYVFGYLPESIYVKRVSAGASSL
jgi:hypothetical protein